MHIFCRETTAHLELHPHLHNEESSSSTLITPDLWMKNCRSPEVRSPSPPVSPSPIEENVQVLPLSLISVTHPTKLLDVGDSRRNRLKSHKKSKKKLPATVTCNNVDKTPPSDMPQDLRIRHSPVKKENNTHFSKIIDNNNSQKDKLGYSSTPQVTPSFQKDSIPSQQISSDQVTTEEQQNATRKIFEKLLPPPTILYPYPIFLPVPIPIPIPIPIPVKKTVISKQTNDVCVQTETQIDTAKDANIEDVADIQDIDVVTISDNKKLTKIRRALRKRKNVVEIAASVKNRRM